MQEVSLAEMRAGCAGTVLATFSTTTAKSGEVIKTKAVAAASLINERVLFLWGASRFREFFVVDFFVISRFGLLYFRYGCLDSRTPLANREMNLLAGFAAGIVNRTELDVGGGGAGAGPCGSRSTLQRTAGRDGRG